jgi:hypothetical protein
MERYIRATAALAIALAGFALESQAAAQEGVAQAPVQQVQVRRPSRPGVRVRGRERARVHVVPQPPQPRVEVRPPPPRPNMSWQEGHWRWDRGRHRWVAGRWARQPRGRVWQPPRWEQRGQTWVLVPGYWMIAPVTPLPPAPPPSPPPAPGLMLPFEEWPDEEALPMVVPLAVAMGVPAAMLRGGQPAFWIWTDANGVWHLRLTSPPGEWRRFQGRIVARRDSNLRITAMTALGLRDRIQERPRAIVFDFQTAGGIDGIDFVMDGTDCARFRLRVDGHADGAIKAIFLGNRATPAPGPHFLVCR